MPLDEDSIYTAKRILNKAHSGIEPQNMIDFSLIGNDQYITVQCSPPPNTIIDGQLLCTVAGVRVVRWMIDPVLNKLDLLNSGTLIADVKAGSTLKYKDSGLMLSYAYYYGFFPYSDKGIYNTNHKNILWAFSSSSRYYAFDQDFSNLDPATTISYPLGFMNTDYTPMMTNEGNGTVTAGSWLGFLQNTLMNYPFMVKFDGTTDYQLDPDDYTKKIDGTVSDYDNTSYSGAGAFAWLNKIYIHEEYSSTGESREVQFSTTAEDGFYPIGFVNPSGEELEGVWLPMGYISATGKSLIASNIYTGYDNATMNTYYSLINNKGATGAYTVFLGGPILNLLRDLEYMLFKSTDIQKCAGYGLYDWNNEGTDQTKSYNKVIKNGIVPGWYGTSDWVSYNKYFHSQVLGNYCCALLDPYTIINSTGNVLVSPYYSYSTTGSGYVDSGLICNTGGTLNNDIRYWPSHLRHISNAYGSFPVAENTASSATGLCDDLIATPNGSASIEINERLGHRGMTTECGPAHTRFSMGFGIHRYALSSAAMMVLPQAGYKPKIAT
jgi:hypothetical protein